MGAGFPDHGFEVLQFRIGQGFQFLAVPDAVGLAGRGDGVHVVGLVGLAAVAIDDQDLDARGDDLEDAGLGHGRVADAGHRDDALAGAFAKGGGDVDVQFRRVAAAAQVELDLGHTGIVAEAVHTHAVPPVGVGVGQVGDLGDDEIVTAGPGIGHYGFERDLIEDIHDDTLVRRGPGQAGGGQGRSRRKQDEHQGQQRLSGESIQAFHRIDPPRGRWSRARSRPWAAATWGTSAVEPAWTMDLVLSFWTKATTARVSRSQSSRVRAML